jgi:amino acid transporter
MADSGGTEESNPSQGTLTLRGAIFIGIGAMVGAGIFALFGEAGTIAGAAVWVSFLIGGIIALLQGYSFAKLGARFPSRGGMISWLVRGFGSGLFSGGVVVLGYFSVILVTAMVAVSFGNYATSLFLGEDAAAIWVNIFASLVVVVLTIVNIVGAEAVSKAQTVIVSVVLVILVAFGIGMLTQINPSLLDPAGYPPARDIVSSVALTFFAYLGFGVIAFAGGDLKDAKKNLPRAIYIALGFVMILYVALSIGVFGSLTVEEVIENADTALAVATQSVFGQFGFIMTSVAALFACVGAVNSQLYGSIGSTYTMAKDGALPPAFGERRRGGKGAPRGLLFSAVLILLMANFFNVSAIASVGSAVALAIFGLVTVAHLRLRKETGANRLVLWLALAGTVVAFVLFSIYTIQNDPKLFVVLAVTIVLAWVVEAIWRAISKRRMAREPDPVAPGLEDQG